VQPMQPRCCSDNKVAGLQLTRRHMATRSSMTAIGCDWSATVIACGWLPVAVITRPTNIHGLSRPLGKSASSDLSWIASQVSGG
jgi:hypothetical protein